MHNTRIERLWYDVTNGYSQKWKNFFLELEHHHGLNPTMPAHIWLIHHLFLDAINQDTQDWAQSWNCHKLSTRGQRARTPCDMFVLGMIEHGARGLSSTSATSEAHVPPTQLVEYGVDWETLDNPLLMNHHLQHNVDNDNASAAPPNPFSVSGTPFRLSEVICVAPLAPLSPAEIQYLNSQLSVMVDIGSRSMQVRRVVWSNALRLCLSILQDQ